MPQNRPGPLPPDNGPARAGRIMHDRPPERRRGGPAKIAKVAKDRRQSMAATAATGYDVTRRQSYGQTLKKGALDVADTAKKYGNNLARWFGVIDQSQMRDMRQKYVERKKSAVDFEQPTLGFRPGRSNTAFNIPSPALSRCISRMLIHLRNGALTTLNLMVATSRLSIPLNS